MMRFSSRVALPQYSEFFRTEYDQQQNVGALGAHYSILSLPLISKPDSPVELQRLAVIWDQDHDERIITLLEAAYFKGLLAPGILYLAEHKGHVTVITNRDFDKAERKRQSRFWQRVSDEVITGDQFKVELMLEEDYLFDLKEELRPLFKTYLDHIDHAWTLGPNAYHRRNDSDRPRGDLFNAVNLNKRSW